MNYRHAFHAGNHADVLKHIVLLACLAHLAKKPGAFAVLDTHGGRGQYDLESSEAVRSPEWQGGIGRLWDWADAPGDIAALREAVAALNPDGRLRLYPGSPVLIRAALRAQDRLIACELHDDDGAALKAHFRGDARAQIHLRDGWEALGALTPFAERRGLVLIDPPYEAEGELARARAAIAETVQRFETGMVLWWRPLKDGAALDRTDIELGQRIARPVLRVNLAVAAPSPAGKLTASSLLLINPPFGLERTLRESLPALADRLSAGPGAGWRLGAP
ncbi:MAG TPA: 23S rRNA (adenine(2030)-N(6))-methyltransferase RlmJ [Caulobacterales bacterium]|nr:23S rRNA (adenine(2030)-N(6))-methyltransferase RlmJ [Caulobacterales bacterium]